MRWMVAGSWSSKSSWVTRGRGGGTMGVGGSDRSGKDIQAGFRALPRDASMCREVGPASRRAPPDAGCVSGRTLGRRPRRSVPCRARRRSRGLRSVVEPELGLRRVARRCEGRRGAREPERREHRTRYGGVRDDGDHAAATAARARKHVGGDPQRESIVGLETALYTAQVRDTQAGELTAAGARGGPDALVTQPFYLGVNDNFGDSQTHAPFTPIAFDVYDAWTQAADPGDGEVADRRAVARGQVLFNTRPIQISGVSGINDEPAFGSPTTLTGTCTTCRTPATTRSSPHSTSA